MLSQKKSKQFILILAIALILASMANSAISQRLAASIYKPNDPLFPKQWALNNTGQDIPSACKTCADGYEDADMDMPEAWTIEKGDSNPVVVAVIDSGIDTTHPDLASKLWINQDEIPLNNIDDDNNGYIDDINGYNWLGIYNLGEISPVEVAKTDAYPVAQSFRGNGQTITHLEISLDRVGVPAPSTISIRSSLNGPDLASSTINYSLRDSDGRIYQPLQGSVNTVDGQTYYMVIQPSMSHTSNYLKIYGASKNYYADGAAYSYNGSSWQQEDRDFYFTTNPSAVVRDSNGHGTAVSGLIAATVNNKKGIAGISAGAKIMTLITSGISDDINAINYAIANGADIINMSFAGDYSTDVQAAVNSAYNAGITMFASAGNANRTNIAYPAGYENVIGVGATNKYDRHDKSNFNSSVDVSAPASDTLTTMPTYKVDMSLDGYAKNYDYFGGTSASSPIAAGVAALILARNPQYTPAQIQADLQSFADDLGTKGRDDYFGHGRINAYASLLRYNFSVKSSTHKIGSNFYKKNNAGFTWSIIGLNGIKGYSFVLGRKSNVKPDSKIDTAAKSKTYKGLTNGTWYFNIKALYGNPKRVSAIFSKRINIDRTRPKTYAPKPSNTRKGQTAKIYYKVQDSYSANKASIHIYLLKGRKTVKKYFISLARVNRLSAYSFKANLPRGKYTFYIYAQDQALNWQSNVASNYLIVK